MDIKFLYSLRIKSHFKFKVLSFIAAYHFILPVNLFSLDVNYPLIYEDPQRGSSGRSTYFGYSVLGYSRNNYTWIQIGAPRANDSRHPDINEPGLVYRCKIGGECLVYNVASEENQKSTDYYDRKQGSWLGATMALHPVEDLLVVCSPRWINQLNGSDWHILGGCYIRHASDENHNRIGEEKLIPLLDKAKYYKEYKSTKATDTNKILYYSTGQAGMSAYFPQDLRKHNVELVLGAPGIFNWKGSAILLKKTKTNKDNDIKMDEKNILDTTNSSKDGDYLGYSVAAGRFFSQRQLFYAASAPRGRAGLGKVIIFKFNKDKEPRMKKRIFGNKFGGYFGAVIEVANLTNDGIDDLIVSAPRLAVPIVYIYWKEFNETTQLRAPSSLGWNSCFGSALATADLDLDGHREVLVGAPYAHDGVGAIVIWAGGPKGPQGNVPPALLIKPSDFFPGIRGFGIAIAPPVDLDGNSYPDVVVGAHLRGHTVVLRTRPIAKIKMYLGKEGINQLLRDTSNFTVPLCLNYSSPFKLSVLNVVIRTSIDVGLKRAFIKGSSSDGVATKTESLSSNVEKCENIIVHMDRDIQNFIEPLRISVSAKFLDYTSLTNPIVINKDNITGSDFFDKLYPTADSTEWSKDIPFATGCGGDDFCRSDLIVDIFTDSVRPTYILGSTETLKLKIVVKNIGEPAYSAQVKITLPPLTSIAVLSSHCSILDLQILCNIDNPLKANITKIIWIEIDMQEVSSMKHSGDRLEFKAEAISNSNETNPWDNIYILNVVLQFEASVKIVGQSQQDVYNYDKPKKDIYKEIVDVEQFFEIHKSGISLINDVLLSVRVPYFYTNATGSFDFMQIYQPMGTFNGESFSCLPINFSYVSAKGSTVKKDSIVEKDRILPNNIKEFFLPNWKIKKISSNNVVEMRNKDGSKKINSTSENILWPNRTIIVSCGDSFLCHEVKCIVGPFKRSQSPARLHLKMAFNISLLHDLLMGEKDIILLKTEGTATILDTNRTDIDTSVVVESVVVISFPVTEIFLWQIICSIVFGFLVIVVTSCALYKIGFFDRKSALQIIKQAHNTGKFAENDIVCNFQEPIEDLPCEDLINE